MGVGAGVGAGVGGTGVGAGVGPEGRGVGGAGVGGNEALGAQPLSVSVSTQLPSCGEHAAQQKGKKSPLPGSKLKDGQQHPSPVLRLHPDVQWPQPVPEALWTPYMQHAFSLLTTPR